MDEAYAEEYKRLLIEVIDRPELPILFNLNVGHALPRCIIPFGVNALWMRKSKGFGSVTEKKGE